MRQTSNHATALRPKPTDDDLLGCLVEPRQSHQPYLVHPMATLAPHQNVTEKALNDGQETFIDMKFTEYKNVIANWDSWNIPMNPQHASMASDPRGYAYHISYHSAFFNAPYIFPPYPPCAPQTSATTGASVFPVPSDEYEPLSLDAYTSYPEDFALGYESEVDPKPYLIAINSMAESTSRPVGKTFPSERADLELSNPTKSAEEASRLLHVIGSTLRNKADKFIDTSIIPVPHCHPNTYPTTDLFPDRLYTLLAESDVLGWTDIVSFQPHGRSFRVHNKELFVKKLLPRILKGQGSWSSFLRQLRLYGFSRTTNGADDGAYYHELFLRSRPDLCQYMRRVGTPHGGLDRRKFKLQDGKDPDFYLHSLYKPMPTL